VIEHPHEGEYAESDLNARFAAIGWTVEQVEEQHRGARAHERPPAMTDATPAERPEPTEFIVEFGEPIYLRPAGCPQCSYEGVTVEAVSCEQCGAEFPPW